MMCRWILGERPVVGQNKPIGVSGEDCRERYRLSRPTILIDVYRVPRVRGDESLLATRFKIGANIPVLEGVAVFALVEMGGYGA